MAGTKQGGVSAAQTNKKRHGSDFYARIGARGGRAGGTGGFYANRELAKLAGAIGGSMSKRGPALTEQQRAERLALKRKLMDAKEQKNAEIKALKEELAEMDRQRRIEKLNARLAKIKAKLEAEQTKPL